LINFDYRISSKASKLKEKNKIKVAFNFDEDFYLCI